MLRPFVAMALALLHTCCALADSVSVSNAAELVAALLSAPDIIRVSSNITVALGDWPLQPIRLSRGVTIQGLSQPGPASYPVLDFTWSGHHIIFAPNTTSTFRHVAISRWKEDMDEMWGFDMACYSPNATVIWENVVAILPAAVPPEILVPGVEATPRSPRAPATPGNVQLLEAIGAFCIEDTAGTNSCYPDTVHFTSVCVSVPDSARNLCGSGGFDFFQFNVTQASMQVLDTACIRASGIPQCYDEAVQEILDPLSPPTPPPLPPQSPPAVTGGDSPDNHLALILPLSIIGFLLLVGALTVGVMYVLMWHHGRFVLHMKFLAPGAGGGTTLAVTDIESSTLLWESLPSNVMDASLKLHHDCIRKILSKHYGVESATEGDSFIIGFHSCSSATIFAIEVQDALMKLDWPPELLSSPHACTMWATSTDREHKEKQHNTGRAAGDTSKRSNESQNAFRRKSKLGPSPSMTSVRSLKVGAVHEHQPGATLGHSLAEELARIWKRSDVRMDGNISIHVHQDPAHSGPVKDSNTARDNEKHGPVSVLVFRGLRIRIGLHAGVQERDITRNRLTNRTMYNGPPLSHAKATGDVGQGGMTVLSSDAFRRLVSEPEYDPHSCNIIHIGDFQAAFEHGADGDIEALYQVLPHDMTRLAFLGTARAKRPKVFPGTLDAPVGLVSIVFMQLAGHSILSDWNAQLTANVDKMFAATVAQQLMEHQGYMVELSEGFCLASFKSPGEAVSFSLACKDQLAQLPWPQELLDHELCGEITIPVCDNFACPPDEDIQTATVAQNHVVLARGPRLKVGIDYGSGEDLRAGISSATGRMVYRGRMMNRAARIASKATTGKEVLCSADAWGLHMQVADHSRNLVQANSEGYVHLKGVGELEIMSCRWLTYSVQELTDNNRDHVSVHHPSTHPSTASAKRASQTSKTSARRGSQTSYMLTGVYRSSAGSQGSQPSLPTVNQNRRASVVELSGAGALILNSQPEIKLPTRPAPLKRSLTATRDGRDKLIRGVLEENNLKAQEAAIGPLAVAVLSMLIRRSVLLAVRRKACPRRLPARLPSPDLEPRA